MHYIQKQRCVPLPLLVQSSSMLAAGTSDEYGTTNNNKSSGDSGSVLTSSAAVTIRCPFCYNNSLGAIQILPLSSDLIEQAVEIRRQASGGGGFAVESKCSDNVGNGNDQSTCVSGSQADLVTVATGDNQQYQQQAVSSSTAAATAGSKRKRLSSFGATMAEASYLLLSSSYSPLEDLSSGGNSLFTDGEFQRTGRWSGKEMEYVDFLLNAFDRGQLPLPNGVRLNDFLCQIFLCKSSRLTKKLKNARLSARTYQLAFAPALNNPQSKPLDYALLSSLQENFLLSLSNEASQLELRFHLSKTWRMQFANLCSQLSCKILDDKAWLSSLEQLELRATEAEETIRKARRRRMGLALKTDAKTVSEGVFFAGMPFQRPVSELTLANRNETIAEGGGNEVASQQQQNQPMPKLRPAQRVSSTSLHGSDGNDNVNNNQPSGKGGGDNDSIISSPSSSTEDIHIHTMLELAAPMPPTKARDVGGGQSLSGGFKMNSSADSLHDFADIFDDLMENASQNSNRYSRGSLGTNGGSFLDSMIEFVEMNNLPFEHVDVWVPSLNPAVSGAGIGSGAVPDPNSNHPGHVSIRLCHAGHATRSDLDPALSCQLYEYGEYSIKYSFAPGSGLPGRAFTSFQSIWDCRIDEANPKYFERAGGAKVYGVKTAVGIPLKSLTTGCIIVAFYSVNDIRRDDSILETLQQELALLRPEPKWKLVVDNTGDNGVANKGLSRLSSAGIGVIEPGFSLMMQQNGGDYRAQATQVRQQLQNSDNNALSTGAIRSEEVEIARILGECMPLVNDGNNNNNGAFGGGQSLSSDLDLYVSLRLLLLRPSDRRTANENIVVEIIRKSYEGYNSASSRWNSTIDLASLVVKDWSYLRSSILQSTSVSPTSTITSIQQQGGMQLQPHLQQPQNRSLMNSPAMTKITTNGPLHTNPEGVFSRSPLISGFPSSSYGGLPGSTTNHQCHVMEVPKISTFATTGAPVRMPFFLGSTINNSSNPGGSIPTQYARDRSSSYPPSMSMATSTVSNTVQNQQQQNQMFLGQSQTIFTSTTPNLTPTNYHVVDDNSS
jgi:hypothetical protein